MYAFLLYCLKITVSRKIPSGYNLACMDPRKNTTVSICEKTLRLWRKKKKESSEKSFLKNVHPTVMVGDLMAFCTSGVKN